MKSIDVVDDGAGLGPSLEIESIGVGFLSDESKPPPLDLEFVDRLFAQTGHEDFPDAGSVMKPHWVTPPIPLIEVADQTDSFCVWRPHCEMNTSNSVHHANVGPELFIISIVGSFGHQMQIVVG